MLKAKRNEINEQGKEKKPANEMNEQVNEHVDHLNTIRELIDLFETEIFLSSFTNILNLIYFPSKL
jgi:uncharacterized coiled-coil DUF342 family protein